MLKKKRDIEIEETIELDEKEIAFILQENESLGSSSIIGSRENQQDAFYAYKDVENDFLISIVCDGMGGLNGGEVASNTVVDFIKNHINVDIEEADLGKKMYEVTIEANEVVRDLKDEDGNPLKAGTTMVMTIVKNGKLYWAAVGDSKIYLLRGDEIVSLNNEHNYSFLVEMKKDDENFVFNPNMRPDALVSYLGAPKLHYIDVNTQPLELMDNDILILCSDGLYKNLNEEQIKIMFLSENQNMQRVAEMLTTAASMDAVGFNQDNTTVVVFKYLKNSFYG